MGVMCQQWQRDVVDDTSDEGVVERLADDEQPVVHERGHDFVQCVRAGGGIELPACNCPVDNDLTRASLFLVRGAHRGGELGVAYCCSHHIGHELAFVGAE